MFYFSEQINHHCLNVLVSEAGALQALGLLSGRAVPWNCLTQQWNHQSVEGKSQGQSLSAFLWCIVLSNCGSQHLHGTWRYMFVSVLIVFYSFFLSCDFKQKQRSVKDKEIILSTAVMTQYRPQPHDWRVRTNLDLMILKPLIYNSNVWNCRVRDNSLL